MGKKTGVPYADHAFNACWGCSPVSAGCANCYARWWAETRWHIPCFGEKRRKLFADPHWREPLLWDESAKRTRTTPSVLCCDMADIFDPEWPKGVRERLWGLQEQTKHLFWMNLTKRVENAPQMLPKRWWNEGFPPNIGMGATVESDKYLWRLDILKEIPVRLRWVSAEPLLSPVDLKLKENGIGFVATGSESGLRIRKTLNLWLWEIAEQGREAGVPVYVKQIYVTGDAERGILPGCLKKH